MNKIFLTYTMVCVSAILLTAVPLTAQATDASAKTEQIAKQRKAYPLKTCVVSGDKLEKSDMGEPVDYIYEETGKEPRLVRLCCKGCIKSFKKDPAKYLTMIDNAKTAGASNTAPAGDGHTGHTH